MKNFILLALTLLITYTAQSQTRQISWYDYSASSYVTSNFSSCAPHGTKIFRISYNHCPSSPTSPNCISGCGANRVRYTMTLYRNGTAISTQNYQLSSHWCNMFFSGVTASPGTYRGYIKVERRRSGCIFGWETIHTGYTNTITVGTSPATPDFNINGIPVPTSGYITSCISNIRLNAAATTCESKYYVGVQECNQWWSRTYKYEWGRWFSGQAPNNINLQALSATYSTGASFLGTDPSRQGDILIGGNLPSGQARFYRVSICTGEPSWTCKTALVRINPGCKLDPSTIIEDTNEYIELDKNQLTQMIDDSNIEITYEGDVEEENPFETFETATINISPNPFNSTTTVSINNYEGNAPILFEVYNALGERVQSLQTTENQFELQRNKLSAGIYMYRATVEDQLLGSGKVIIE